MSANIKEFFVAMISAHPDVLVDGTFNNCHATNTKKKFGINIPAAIWKNRVSRGLYAIPTQYLTVVDDDTTINARQTAQPMTQSRSTPVPETQQIEAFIPNIDETFVPFGAFKDVESVVKSKMFYPMYITGLSGNGKSTMVEQICAKHNRAMIRVNLNAMSDEEQLIGSKTLVDGNVEIVEGPILIAMRTGALCLVDEIDAGTANALLCLQSILEGKPYYFKLKNEIIIPAPGFNVIATANTKGKGNDNGQFIGTNILNEAFLERFGVCFEQEYPSAAIELRIIKNKMEQLNCYDESFASCLSKWADAIRRTFDAGGCDEIMSTRRIIHIVSAFSIFNDKKKSVELCCNRFDTQTKQAFLTMFSAISPDETLDETLDETKAQTVVEEFDAVEIASTIMSGNSVHSS